MKKIAFWDSERGKQVIPRDHIKHITANEKNSLWRIDIQDGAETYTAYIHIKPKDFKIVKNNFKDWRSSNKEDWIFSFCDYQDLDKERRDPINASALTRLLNGLDRSACSTGEKGRLFEALTLAYLQSEPKWKKKFRQVRTFAEWAEAHPNLAGKNSVENYTKDVGIDLVADNIEEGKFTAIQCKFYARYNKLLNKLLDTFVEKSNSDHFTHRLLVCTNEITSPQHETYSAYKPPIEIVDRWVLENSEVDWNSLLNISFEQTGRNPPFSVKPEISWKKNLMDSVDKTSKKTCNYHNDIELVLRWLKKKGILREYREEEGDKKERKIVLIPEGGLTEGVIVIRQLSSLDGIAKKIRCRCLDRDPFLLARDLLEYSDGEFKGRHGETHREMTLAIWEVTDIWDSIATMISTAEYAIKAINGEYPPSQEDRCNRAFDVFKEAEAEFKRHEEKFDKYCMRFNDKYKVNNLDEVKKYLSKF